MQILMPLIVVILVWAVSLLAAYHIIKAAVRDGASEALSNIRQFPVVIAGDMRQQKPTRSTPGPHA